MRNFLLELAGKNLRLRTELSLETDNSPSLRRLVLDNILIGFNDFKESFYYSAF
jgi:hypothetical protein